MTDKDTHTPLASHLLAQDAIDAYLAGLAAVEPATIVRRAVRQGFLDDWFGDLARPKWLHVLALGKAAPRMVWGLVEASVPFRGLGVAPKGVAAPNVDTFHWLSGDHPLPGAASFAAGRAVLEWIAALPREAPVLVLLSGGASSCVEVPLVIPEEQLRAKWREWMREGLDIVALNRERAAISVLKGGKLGRRILERTPNVRAWLLADTPPAAAPAAVGSGPFFQSDSPDRIPHRVLAGNDEMVVNAGLRLGAMGYTVYRHDKRIDGDAESETSEFVAAFTKLPGEKHVALVGGGEATVRLPQDAPPGGRCQHAALAAAQHLAKTHNGGLFFAAASDGIDGTTDAAGAWTTGADCTASAVSALRRFDAHAFLNSRGRLLHMGATGTNVNDLWVALR